MNKLQQALNELRISAMDVVEATRAAMEDGLEESTYASKTNRLELHTELDNLNAHVKALNSLFDLGYARSEEYIDKIAAQVVKDIKES